MSKTYRKRLAAEMADTLEKEMRWAFALYERGCQCQHRDQKTCAPCKAEMAIDAFMTAIAEARLQVISAVANDPSRPSASE
jgi:hypothetical protein